MVFDKNNNKETKTVESIFMDSLKKLCNPKTGIILKQNKKPIFNDDEILRIKNNFISSKINIIMIPQMKPIEIAEGKNGLKSIE